MPQSEKPGEAISAQVLSPALPVDDKALRHHLFSRFKRAIQDAEASGRIHDFAAEFEELLSSTVVRAGAPRPTDFLVHADRLDKHGKTDTALDIIYDQIDEMLRAGKFADVNDCLRNVATDNHSVHILLALLTITLAAKRKLPDRAAFYARTVATLKSRGELEDGLLIGLD